MSGLEHDIGKTPVDPEVEVDAEETRRLRRCVRDLVALSALPTLWTRFDPTPIAESLADALMSALRPDIMYVCLKDGEVATEAIRGASSLEIAARGQEISRTFAPWRISDGSSLPGELSNPLGEGVVRIASAPIGHAAELGVLAAASQWVDFPTETDRLLLTIAANQAAVALARGKAEAALRRSEEQAREERRVIEIINRVGQQLAAELDLETLVQVATDAATELTGAKFGAFFYNTVNEQGESYLLYSLSGVPREAFANFPLPRNTALFGPTFRGEATVRLDDVRQDSRYGKNPPYYGMPEGHLPVASYLAVPVVSRSGEVLGGLFFGHPKPGVFTDRHERIVEGIAAQAAIATDNARLYQEAQREITERKQAQAALAEADRRKDEFLAILAHELRNPLAPIRNAVYLLKKMGPGEPYLARARAIIERQVNQQARLLDDLLDVSRISRGKVTLRPERLDLARLVHDTAEDLRSQMEAAGLTFSLELPEQPVWVQGDPTRLAQCVGNLLANAAKFTERGGRVTLWLAARPDDQRAAITVRDTGIGIEQEMLSRVFDRFAQADRSLHRSLGGLGLGLALVKGFVELHGGEVRAESAGVGHGSEFTILLPMAVAPVAAEPAPRLTAPFAEPTRILIVEDNRDAADTLRDVLELSGHVVEVAYSGSEAVEAAPCYGPDVVLCDLGLPGMNGYEVAATLRRHPVTAKARLIALSGYGQEEDRRRSREAGFDFHLTKPVDLAELERFLEATPEHTRD